MSYKEYSKLSKELSKLIEINYHKHNGTIKIKKRIAELVKLMEPFAF